MSLPNFMNLVGTNPTATVLANLTTGSPSVQTAIGTTINSALRTKLAPVLANMPVLAGLSAKINVSPAGLAAAQNTTIQAFLKQQFDPLVANDPAMQKAVDGEIAKVATTGTVGNLLGLGQPLQANILFQADVSKAIIATLLSTSPTLGNNQQLIADFVNAYKDNKGSIQTFWAQLPSQNPEFTSVVVSELQATMQLGTLTLNNIILVQAIQNLRQKGTVQSLQGLLKLDTKAWTNLINTPVNGQAIAVPASISGSTAQEKTANYASAIMTSLQKTFPTAYISQNLAVQPAINIALVKTLLANNPNLNPAQPLSANANMGNLSPADQATAKASWAALNQEINMFPALDYKTALGIGVPSSATPTTFQNPIRLDIATFLNNSPNFDFQSTNIDAYLSANPVALNGISTTVKVFAAELKAIQRIYRITPVYSTIYTVMGAGLYSSKAVTSIPRGLFVRQYGSLFDKVGEAVAFYSQAQSIVAQASTLFMLAKDALSFLKPVVIGDSSDEAQKVLQQSNIPDWQDLFGSTSYCQCGECMAVDGPAAYFVDLLQFLYSIPNIWDDMSSVGYTPLDVLIGYQNNPNNNGATPPANAPIGRRPDLAYLKLSCPNTDTTLPYVDLVNEILESYVVLNGTLNSSTAHNTPRYATANQLNVNPEYTLTAAYNTLNEAIYPLNLPFDRFLEIARNYLGFLGASRHKLMKNFGLFPAPQDKEAMLAAEFLGMNEGEYELVTGLDFNNQKAPNYPAVYPLYGYPTKNFTQPNSNGKNQTLPWFDWLAQVSEFLKRTGLTYAELVLLLKTQNLNPGQTIDLQYQGDPCNVTTTQIFGIPQFPPGFNPVPYPPLTPVEVFFDRVPAFLRLWKKLGWTIPELDKAITAVDAIKNIPPYVNLNQTGRPLVLAVAQLKELQASLKLSVAQLLSLWTDIDTDGRDSIYVKLFQNKTVINPLDSAFQLTYKAYLTVLPSPLPAIWPDGTVQTQLVYGGSYLSFTGAMTDDQRDYLLFTWANNNSAALLAVQNLYNQRWQPGTELAAAQTETISNHGNTILAALGISADDLNAIRTATGLLDTENTSAMLTLSNLSALYRYAVLAQALNLPVKDLISLTILTGLNPFQPAAEDPVTDPMVQFVKAAQKVTASPFSVAQLNYLYRDYDPQSVVAPLDADVELFLTGLQTGLDKIANDNTLLPDPKGEILSKKLAAVLDASTAKSAMDLVSGTVEYSWNLESLPGLTLPGLAGSFNFTPPNLTYPGGSLTSVQAGMLSSLSTDPDYQTAISSLSTPGAANPGALAALPALQMSLSPFVLPGLSSALTYDPAAQRLIFTGGPMGLAQELLLLGFSADPGFQGVVAALFLAASANPSASVPFTGKLGFTLPYPVSGLLSYDPNAQKLSFNSGGAMTFLQEALLLGFSDDPDYREAVQQICASGNAMTPAPLEELPALTIPLAQFEFNVPSGALTYNASSAPELQLTFSGGPMTAAQLALLQGFAATDANYQAAITTLSQATTWPATGTATLVNNPSIVFPAPLSGTLSYNPAQTQLAFSSANGQPMSVLQNLLLLGLSTDSGYQTAIQGLFTAGGANPNIALADLPALTIPLGMFLLASNPNIPVATLTYNPTLNPPQLGFTGGPMSAVQEAFLLSLSTDSNYQSAITGFMANQQANPTANLANWPALCLPFPLAGQLSYDPIGKQITFLGGPINPPELALLLSFSADPGYKAAIGNLYQQGIAVASAPLAALPSLAIPLAPFFGPSPANSLAYDPASQTLSFLGPMSDFQKALILGWSSDPNFQTAINYLYQQPRDLLEPVQTQPFQAQPVISLPPEPSDTIAFDTSLAFPQLVFSNGPMTPDQEALLLSLSADASYQTAIKSLFNTGIETATVPLAVLPQAPNSIGLPAVSVLTVQPQNTLAYDAVAQELRFSGTMTLGQKAILIDLSSDEGFQSAINGLFNSANLSVFLSDDLEEAIDKLINHPLTTAERYEYVLGKLLDYLCDTQSRSLVKTTLASNLSLDSQLLQLLIEGTSDPDQSALLSSQNPADPSQPAIEDFLALGGQALPGIMTWASAAYELLFKTAILVNGFKIGADEAVYLSNHPWDFAGTDPGNSGNQVPFDLDALPLETTGNAELLGVLGYDPVEGELTFPGGLMTPAQKSLLQGFATDKNYLVAVANLFNGSPAPLPVLPALTFPAPLSATLSYDPTQTQLVFSNANGQPMSLLQKMLLLGFSTDSGYQTAVNGLFTAASANAKAPLAQLPALAVPLAPFFWAQSTTTILYEQYTPQLILAGGPMTARQEELLLGFSTDASYQAAVAEYFQQEPAISEPMFDLPILSIPIGPFISTGPTSFLTYDYEASSTPSVQLTFTGGPMTAAQLTLFKGFAVNEANYQTAITTLSQATTWPATASATLANNPSLVFPAPLSGTLSFNPTQNQLAFASANGMSVFQKQLLLGLSMDPGYQAAIQGLFAAGGTNPTVTLADLPALTIPLGIFQMAYNPGLVTPTLTYDPTKTPPQLGFAGGPMTFLQDILLQGFSPDPGYQTAIEALYAAKGAGPNTAPWNSAGGPFLFILPAPLAGEISYDPTTQLLTFTGGPMSQAQQVLLLSFSTDPGYQGAIGNLFKAEAPTASAALAKLPALTIPLAPFFQSLIPGNLTYNPSLNPPQLGFTNGPMTADQFNLLLGLSTNPPYQSAVTNLYLAGTATATTPLASLPQLSFAYPPLSGQFTYNPNLSTNPRKYAQVVFSGATMTPLQEALLLGFSQDPGYQAAVVKLQANPAANQPLTGQSVFSFPPPFSALLSYNFVSNQLTFTGGSPMSPSQAALLLGFSATPDYQTAVNQLFQAGTAKASVGLALLPPLTIPFEPFLSLQADTLAPAFFNQWLRLLDIFDLVKALPKGNETLFDIFQAASSSPVPSQLSQTIVNVVLAATQWDASEFTALTGFESVPGTTLSFNLTDADFRNERGLRETGLVQLAKCLALGSKTGISCGQLFQWANLAPDSAQAQDIQNTVKAQYGDDAWLNVGKPLNDKSREKSKEALIAYILNMPSIIKLGFTDADDLYEYFLIDVQMCTCMETSRLVQATAAVQLFTQRCLMNLENDNPNNPQLNVAPSQIDATEWDSWRKNYRLWQANREVFLYPENWIDPTIRDDRTPFFEDLQNDLLQGPITADNAEQAFLNYLEKLDQVAQLEICGMYWQLDPNPQTLPDGTTDATNDILHVFGRTYTTPYSYFYRRLLNASLFGQPNSPSIWTPWEAVNLNISTDHLIPVVWNRRPYLFWPTFNETADSNAQGTTSSTSSSPTQTAKNLAITLSWSEYKQGKWGAIQTTPNPLIPAGFNPYTDTLDTSLFTFYASAMFDSANNPVGLGVSVEYPMGTGQNELANPGFQNDGGGNAPPWTGTDNTQFMNNPGSGRDDGGNSPFLKVTADSSHQDTYLFGQSERIPAAAGQTWIASVYGNNEYGNLKLDQTGIVKLEFLDINGNIIGSNDNVFITSASPNGYSQGSCQLVAPEGTAFVHLQAMMFTGSQGQTSGHVLFDDASLLVQLPTQLGTFLIPSGSGNVSFLNSNNEVISVPVTNAEFSYMWLEGNGPLSFNYSTFLNLSNSYSYQLLFPQDDFINLLNNMVPYTNDPFFFSDSQRTYFVMTASLNGRETDNDRTQRSEPFNISGQILSFNNHWHPFVGSFIQALNGFGVPGLLTLANQTLSNDGGVLSGLELSISSNNLTLAPVLTSGVLSAQGTPFEIQDTSLRAAPASSTNYLYYTSIPSPHFYYHSSQSPITPGDAFIGTVATSTINVTAVTGPTSFEKKYQPTFNIDQPFPFEEVDLTTDGAYSIYNWEIFFHIPLLIATQLSQNQQFEDAQTWFHYIFNPTNDSGGPAPNRYWNFLLFNEASEPETLSDYLQNLDNPSSSEYGNLQNQVAQYQTNPFDPDAIARLRTVAYQKTVVMKYLDNLIAWGDNLFAQNTRESINEATQIYVLAQQILGPKPVVVPSQGIVQVKAYLELGQLDLLSDVMVNMENIFPFTAGPGGGNSASSGVGVNNSAVANTFYFCIPPNANLLGYWDTVADRLYKIRHCMNIQGQVEQLPLFAPPINPALLVEAAAAGVDLTSLLSDINAAVPLYRFNFTFSKALELCAEVRSLGGSLLSALEKKDAEALSLLRAGQEVAVLQAVLLIKQNQVNEAQANWQGLNDSLAVTQAKKAYYQTLVTGGLSSLETGQVNNLTQSQVFKELSQSTGLAGSYLSLMPQLEIGVSGISSPVSTFSFGGQQLSTLASMVAQAFSAQSEFYSFSATMSGLLGSWGRRGAEWIFQLNTAGLEITQINDQISAANFRLQIAQQDYSNQNLQISNAQAVQDFLTSKFTNDDLYSWMIDQVSAVYFQCYQLAYDLAKRAEACFRFELGLSNSNYIQFGYWDSLKQGLLSGEKLYLDLKRMEGAYLDQNKREYEITRNISLVLLDPVALITLKETGQCLVTLPEAYFDMDYPGHYMRRLKNVSLTIPCVTGPYTSVNCTLTLLQSKIRWDNDVSSGYPENPVASDERFFYNFSATQSIATSTAQNDSGMFEVNFRDERYLPFEGAGAVSQWLISMPKDCNAFDFETITDAIINLKYTARDGGAIVRDAARQAAVMPAFGPQTGLDGPPAPYPSSQANLDRFFSLKHEFPSEWYQFLNPADPNSAHPNGGQIMSIPLTRERFPFQYRGKAIAFNQFELFLKLKAFYPPSSGQTNSTPQQDYSGGTALSFTIAPPGTAALPPPIPTFKSNPNFANGVPYASIKVNKNGLGIYKLSLGNTGQIAASLQVTPPLAPAAGAPTYQLLNPALVEDIYLICHYSAG